MWTKKILPLTLLVVAIAPAHGGESSGAAKPVFPTTVIVALPQSAGETLARSEAAIAKEVAAGRLAELRKESVAIGGQTLTAICARFGTESPFRYSFQAFSQFKKALIETAGEAGRVSEPLSCERQQILRALGGIPLTFGRWGGRGVRVDVSANGAKLEYDCAHGKIDEQIFVDDTGRFEVTGVHVGEHGGPIHPDEHADLHPARYVGRVDANSQTLSYTITLTDTGQTLGKFVAQLGKPALLMKCL